METTPSIESILTVTDFSMPSFLVFEQALALTLRLGARLTVLYVNSDDSNPVVDWGRFPKIRDKLGDWGFLDKWRAPGKSMSRLGIEVSKVALDDRNLVSGILRYLTRHRIDLVIGVNDPDSNIRRLLEPALVPALVRLYCKGVLLLPDDRAPLISDQGHLECYRWLIPATAQLPAAPAIDLVADLAPRLAKPDDCTANVLEVGEQEQVSSKSLPQRSGLVWHRSADEGDPTSSIIRNATAMNADIITCGATDWGSGASDTSSQMEQIVKQSHRPVLVVPALHDGL